MKVQTQTTDYIQMTVEGMRPDMEKLLVYLQSISSQPPALFKMMVDELDDALNKKDGDGE